jgi:hypothetical protein
MRITFGITAKVEGELSEVLSLARVPKAPTLEELLASMRNLCFIAETVAHLRGQENLLEQTDLARKQIAALQPIDVPTQAVEILGVPDTES